MSEGLCSECRKALRGLSDDKLQADKIERDFPSCACEAFSVGIGSPGKVENDEFLYRLIISPGDIDEEGNLLLNALRTVKEDGLSVFREGASDHDVEALVADRLSTKAGTSRRVVQGLLRFQTLGVRALAEPDLGRSFCVYDETVPRKVTTSPRVPTHVTVLQRLYAGGTQDRNGKNKKTQTTLFEFIHRQLVDLSTFRGGLLLHLNEKSLAGGFELDFTG